MKIAILGYVPPPTFNGAKAFLDNVRGFKTKHDLVLYSDHPYGDGVLQLKASPEVVRGAANPKTGAENKFAINNLIFLTGLVIASLHQYTHIIYLESDCRVGCDHWDQVMCDEVFALGKPIVAAGSLVCYNPVNAGPEAARRWSDTIAEHNKRRNYPIPTYGWVGAAVPHPSCVFTNGALSLLSMAWMRKLFPLENTPKLAAEIQPWDMEIGIQLWDLVGVQAYDLVHHIYSIFSSYGEVLSTETERLDWLRSGKHVAVHQVKSAATV